MAKSSRRSRSSGSGGSRRTYLIVGAVIVVFVAGFIALAVLDARQQSGGGAPDDVKTYDVGPAGEHTEGDVDYEQSPPAGGRAQPCLAELRLLRQACPRRECRTLPGARGGLDHLLPRPPAGPGRRAAGHRREPVLRPGQPLSRPAFQHPRGGLGLGQAGRPERLGRPRPGELYPGLPAGSPDPGAWRRLHRRHERDAVAAIALFLTHYEP